jgi:hypothetical protein
MVTVRVDSSQDEGATRFFDTEMLALNIAGGNLPPNVMVRESPTKASLGRTSIRRVNDPATGIWDYISSFFDIFTEVSLDGGQTWQPSTSLPGTMSLRQVDRCPDVEISIVQEATGPVALICWREGTDCKLWCTRSLNDPISWQLANLPQVTVNGRICVKVDISRGMGFYRLCSGCPEPPLP